MKTNYLLCSAVALPLALGLGAVAVRAEPPGSTSQPAPPAEGPPVGGQSNPDLKNGADKSRTDAVSTLEKTPKDNLQTTGSFLKEVAMSNMAEVQASKFAVDHASDPKVKELASTMVSDHEKMAIDLQQLAQKKSIPLPTDVDARRRSVMKRLESQKPKDFDNAYLKQMIHDHEELIGFLKREIGTISDKETDTRDLMTSSLPTIQHHHEMAAALLKARAAQH